MNDTKAHKPVKSHPFRRHVATTEETARDEWYVLNHGNIIAYRAGGRGHSGAGWGR